MRALVLDADGRLRLDPAQAEPCPSPDEALVHVRLAGICATDRELVRGYAGYVGVLGHEFVGVVDAGDPEWAGRRVVADINVGCGRCSSCLGGDSHHCRARATIGIRGRQGAFADRIAIPRANLVAIPDSIPDEVAVFAEPLAAALHTVDELGDAATITVLGDGKLGLLCALAIAASAPGRRVELIGRHPDKLEIAARAGVSTLLERELGERPTPRAELVVEATGNPGGLARALQLVEPRGTIVLKTTTASPTPVDLTPVVVNELRIVGSRCGDMARAVALLASGRVDPRPLISARYGFDEAMNALEHAALRGTLEIILAMEGPEPGPALP